MKNLDISELLTVAANAEVDSFKIANGMRMQRSSVTDEQRKKAYARNDQKVNSVAKELIRRIQSGGKR